MTASGIGDALDKLLADKPGDEKTGAHASKGFGFQQWWGALAVVESLLAGKQDFAVGMEVKEDVVLLDSATSPTEVEFCQVKKNETAGGWNIKDLHRRGRKREDGSQDLSPLAKLYRRRRDFEGHPTRLRFVSNLSVKVAVSDSASSSMADLSLDDLSEKEKGALRKSLAAQLGVEESSVDLQSHFTERRKRQMRTNGWSRASRAEIFGSSAARDAVYERGRCLWASSATLDVLPMLRDALPTQKEERA